MHQKLKYTFTMVDFFHFEFLIVIKFITIFQSLGQNLHIRIKNSQRCDQKKETCGDKTALLWPKLLCSRTEWQLYNGVVFTAHSANLPCIKRCSGETSELWYFCMSAPANWGPCLLDQWWNTVRWSLFPSALFFSFFLF